MAKEPSVTRLDFFFHVITLFNNVKFYYYYLYFEGQHFTAPLKITIFSQFLIPFLPITVQHSRFLLNLFFSDFFILITF